MKDDSLEHIYKQTEKWIYQAGENIRSKIDEPITVDTKSDAKDLVTTMDKETERFFASNIKTTYPDHKLISEEGYGDDLKALEGTVWIVDPIDGTMNFVEQKRNFAISIGIYQDGIGEIGFIYNVMNDTLYSAKRGKGAYKNNEKLPGLQKQLTLEESMLSLTHNWLCNNHLVCKRNMEELVLKVRGTRSYGSAALEFASVAEGVIDGYLSMKLSPWDIAAGMVIVHEAGGVTTTIDGGDVNMLSDQPILTVHPAIKDSIIKEYIKDEK